MSHSKFSNVLAIFRHPFLHNLGHAPSFGFRGFFSIGIGSVDNVKWLIARLSRIEAHRQLVGDDVFANCCIRTLALDIMTLFLARPLDKLVVFRATDVTYKMSFANA